MNLFVRILAALLLLVGGLLGMLWVASLWWEKAFATRLAIEIGQGGCYRLETYEPFWLFPLGLHPIRHTQSRWNPLLDWYGPWLQPDLPRFYRLYDNRTGELLVQTAVYDLEFDGPTDALWTSGWYAKAQHPGWGWFHEWSPPCDFKPPHLSGT